MTLETLITLLTIENNIIKIYFVTFILSVTGTAFSILEMVFVGVFQYDPGPPKTYFRIEKFGNLRRVC